MNPFQQEQTKENLQKWWKLPNFQNIWNIEASVGNVFSVKYIKVYIIRKAILSACQYILYTPEVRPCIVDLSFILIFYAKTSMWYALIMFIFQDLLIFFATFFSSRLQRSFNTRKPFKKNIIKWKTKQSWKGNVWKYLFILPIFFTWGRK